MHSIIKLKGKLSMSKFAQRGLAALFAAALAASHALANDVKIGDLVLEHPL